MQNFNSLLTVLNNSRAWHGISQKANPLHSAIHAAYKLGKPTDWHLLALEYPHKSKDGLMIAYYPNEEKAIKGIATITKIGKYLKRHFPDITDNVIADIAARFTAKVVITDNIQETIENLPNGPGSCMSDTPDNYHNGIHPYECYDPVFGWSFVARYDAGKYVGRALLNNGIFVRTFALSSHGTGAHGGEDTILTAWLIDNGYAKKRGWPCGTKIKKIGNDHNLTVPYIDGENQGLDNRGDYLRITDSGEFTCRNTDGSADESNRTSCDDCGDRISEDNSHWLGENIERSVCSCCIDNYVYIESVRTHSGRRGGYYVNPNDTITTNDGNVYPDDCYSDFDIVELENGGYVHMDDAVCDSNGDYWHCDDIGTEIAMCDDTSEYETNYFYCKGSNAYYSDNIEPVEINGEKYHPDHVQETE